MGQISDIAASVFRDWETQGVPSSGAHEPDKAETRSLFTEIDDQIRTLIEGFSISGMRGYPSVSAMNADLSNQPVGIYSIILSTDADSLKIYRRDASSWEYVTTLSVAEIDDISQEVDTLRSILSASTQTSPMLTVEDSQGNVGLYFGYDGSISNQSVSINSQESGSSVVVSDRLGFLLTQQTLSGHSVPGGRFEFEGTDPGAIFSICDERGFLGFQSRRDGSLVANLLSSSSNSGSVVQERNAAALANAQAVQGQFNGSGPRLYWNLNHIIEYGQSLSIGAEAFPVLQSNQRGNLMLGNSVRPQSQSGTTFEVVGPTQLNPIVSTAQAQNSGTLYTTDEQFDFPNGDANSPRGTTPAEAAVSFAKHLWNQSRGILSDTQNVFVLTSNGRGATSVAALSKGASPEYYAKIASGAQKVKTIADAQGRSYGVPAVVWIQGESDYTLSTTKTQYKNLMRQLRQDITADVCVAIAGQSQVPAFITYQTGGSYTSDSLDLAVGMAQYELSLEERDWYLACPSYPVTNKSSGHLNSNGSRWLGMQIGKVMHRVLVLGLGWRPLSPNRATVSGNTVIIDFHVPVPPLQFGLPFELYTATDYHAKGFAVFDSGGEVGISSVSIVADAVVQLTLTRETVGTVKIRYAGKAGFNGNGCLMDSDDTLCTEVYTEIVNQVGDAYSEPLPAGLSGTPYPLNNFCIAFNITATGE